MASEREARLEAALLEMACGIDKYDGLPCWCPSPTLAAFNRKHPDWDGGKYPETAGHLPFCGRMRAALAAPPEGAEPRPLDEKHVQFATVSAPLMSAMCAGEWRVGPIIFEAPGGHGSFSAWAILAPWPWLRDGKDTPHAAIERFLAACPPEPPGCSHHGPGCPDPQPYLPSAPPPVTPGESDWCHCRKAVPGMWTSGYDETRRSFVRHGAANCEEFVPAPPPPVTTDEPKRCRCDAHVVLVSEGATVFTPNGMAHTLRDGGCFQPAPPPVTDAGRCPACYYQGLMEGPGPYEHTCCGRRGTGLSPGQGAP